MGTEQAPSLADALFTPVQQRVLGLLFGQPQRQFQSAELIRLIASGTGAVHRQLQRLERSGLLEVTRIGNQKHYRANTDAPIFQELHGLVVKTVAMVEPLRAALAPLTNRIHGAFVFGSLAKGGDRADSDLDLAVISDDLTYPDLYEALQPTQAILARPVNPTVLTRADWLRKQAEPDSFVARIAQQAKLFVVGSESTLD
jgi:predicted nucleotidyltransferase